MHDGLRRQLDFFRRHFDNADPTRLTATIEGRATGPAILLSFDDGYRSNYEVAAPLLEEFGFTGWFFVSSGRLRAEQGGKTADGVEADDFMSVEELRDLAERGHVIGCHTHSHVRLSSTLPSERLDAEIADARATLARLLNLPVDSFCWVGGEEASYSAAAQRLIEREGYALAFMTNNAVVRRGTDPLWIERTNIEADWPLSQVRFYLSGIMDLAYRGKRARIRAKLTEAGHA